MEGFDDFERRTGAERRRGVERRNGLAVLMAGCSLCDRIAPQPAELHGQGWIVESDEEGLVSITCPEHTNAPVDELPDYILYDPNTA
ncbi:MAG TPA: hypothetical protein VH063_14870 [Gaiellaceae bacterium]|jgi:hypothetical protein|nr:hypothetical protein [Gaiellaceae bacterium]